jgi:hypothetical protein
MHQGSARRGPLAAKGYGSAGGLGTHRPMADVNYLKSG